MTTLGILRSSLGSGTAFALISIAMLTGCEEDMADPRPVETGGEAAGEVLGGTISDEMLPLEQLTSTSPPAEQAGEDDAAGTQTASADTANGPATDE